LNAIINFITGRKTAWVTLLLGLIFAGLAFGPLKAASTETQPGVGLPSSAESVKVDEILKDMPGADSTAAVIVYASDSAFTDEQKTWIAGTPDETTRMPVGGANEKFTEFTNVEVMGKAFVPPATLSNDETTAVITIPMDSSDDTEVITERVAELRTLAKEGMPSGLNVYVTGPEGFQADLAGVFAGADFTLLLSTVVVVAVLLLITYRSPTLWLIPLLVVGTADGMSGQLARQVANLFDITPDASVTGILSVLVFGAGTNYALLLIARYREELFTNEDRHVAMAKALKGAGPAIIASGSTVTLALLTLSFADLAGNRSLGLVCATGVVIAMISALAVLPAALVVFGRGLFWPFVPKFGGVNKSDSGLWARLGKGVSKNPIAVSIVGVLLLGTFAAGASGIQIGLASNERFLKTPEAVVGQEILADAFAAGTTTPSIVLARNDQAQSAADAAKNVDGVASVALGDKTAEFTRINVVLDAESQSDDAYAILGNLRTELKTIDGADALIGGQDAQALDVKNAYAHDQALVIPLILALVFIVLVLLLRAFVAPVLLLATVVASFFASMGLGWLLFVNVFNFAGLDLSVFLYSFLFLVALGVDYNIFLVTRAKEEAAHLGVKQGMIKALASTGGVITSAGILLAAVFAVLGVLPLVALAQIGVIVCIGVLLDTLLVRTVIVPALGFMTKKNFFWPAKGYKN
jgi:RND superfamily putative drug exporter